MFLVSLLLLRPNNSWPRVSCLAMSGLMILSLAKIETRVIIIARIIIGRDILLLPIPAFSMAILSLLALSIERKYVVPNKKAKDETIIKYWGTDNSAY